MTLRVFLKRAVALGLLGWGLAGLSWAETARAERELDLGLGYRISRIETRRDQSFLVHGVAPGLRYFEGDELGILVQVEPWVPLGAAQAWDPIDLRGTYDTAWAVDLGLMVAGRWWLSPSLTVTVGGGMQLDGIKLAGAGLRTFNHAALGVGTAASLRWRFRERWAFGVHGTFAVHFVDLAHSDQDNALRWGIGSGLLTTLGVQWDG